MRVYVEGQLHFYGDKQFNTVETNVFVGFRYTHNGVSRLANCKASNVSRID